MKPESRFVKGVHDAVNPDIYHEKMFNPLRGGTPDVFYMGFADNAFGGQLFIEYKYVKTFPKVIKPKLSPLQLAWLMRAHDRGKDPWVVVGSPTGCVVLRGPAEWRGLARDRAQVLSKQELARRIETRCGLQDLAVQPSAPNSSTP